MNALGRFTLSIGLLCAAEANAQSQVSVYGIIDTGVVYTSNANTNGNSIFKMPSLTGEFPSRIGFKGSEDLGGGLEASGRIVTEVPFTVLQSDAGLKLEPLYKGI